CHQYRSDPRTF
nr:immunoglobulin light chain junction region [Macaca mulatta]MOX97224.1 immunoglobulin light chain junction region [Macaca mulatta]MOX97308.1 immunoglobulin light chain junction region [Macaca mulatta]MOX97323.1 immunoglobulin light chain junction region [Macaca mulatta]MOX97332.1 immunoglobulin light chain junction region [Macaca mulatta]